MNTEPLKIPAYVFVEWLVDGAIGKVPDLEGFEKLMKSVLIGMETGPWYIAKLRPSGLSVKEHEYGLYDYPYQEHDYKGFYKGGDGYGNGGDSQYAVFESGDGVGYGSGYGSNDGNGFGNGYGYNKIMLLGDGTGSGDL